MLSRHKRNSNAIHTCFKLPCGAYSAKEIELKTESFLPDLNSLHCVVVSSEIPEVSTAEM